MNKILDIYKVLLKRYSLQGWWPLSKGGYSRHYNGEPENDRDRFEIITGSILTQNTNWNNVEKALKNLIDRNLLSPEKIIGINNKDLASLIRPSGYYNQKAERLKIISKFFLENKYPDREELLNLKGVGKETADSILLYAYNKPYFVIDAYTKRIFNRLGFDLEDYDNFQDLFHKNLEKDYKLFNEFHALIVKLAKEHCRVKPVCEDCCLKKRCNYSSSFK